MEINIRNIELTGTLTFPFTVLVFFIFLISCSSNPAIKKNITMCDTIKSVVYNNIYEAFRGNDLEYLSKLDLKKDEIALLNTLNLIYYLKLDSAEILLKTLISSSKDDSIYFYSMKILFDLYFFKSDWSKLLNQDSLANRSLFDEDNIMLLASAYNSISKENVVYNEFESIIDFRFSPSRCPIVPVLVNGRLRYFWFDTGANYSVISSDIASECNVEPIIFKYSKALTSTSLKINIYPSYIKNLMVGNINYFNHPVVIVHDFDLKMKMFGNKNTKIDGIIGWKAIQKMNLTIDYINKKIIIRKPIDSNFTNRNLYWLGCPIVKFTAMNGVRLNFGLDLGSETTAITNSIFKKIAFNKIYDQTKQKGSAGGWVYFNARMVSNLGVNIADHFVEFNNIGTTFQIPHLFISLDGILGSDFISEGITRIDLTNGIFDFSLKN